MKPAIRNGLTALILTLLAISVGAVVVRHRRSDRTNVSAAPVVSTTTPPTTTPPTTTPPTTASPTTETTVTTVTTVTTETSGTTVSPTSSGPTTGAGATTTTVPDTTTVPGADRATVQAGPPGLAEHPHTGRRSLLLPATVLIGVGLAGLRMTRRTRPTSTA
ncbi:MAG: hypothetical protein ACR2LJ_08700 [Acidimicrobiales bacterium]